VDQEDLFGRSWNDQAARFPSTRYQGSKRKLLPWLLACLEPVPGQRVLDAFSGTAAVAYGLKAQGRAVSANDALAANHVVARALVANDDQRLEAGIASSLFAPGAASAGSYVRDTFGGVYYTDAENAQLDRAVARLETMAPGGARDLAWFALFQACLCKRPYNLFHRRNLDLRTRDVPRTFGNKATWERAFGELAERFAAEASAAVFAGERACHALCGDVLHLEGEYDMVYLDPPYVPARGAGADYLRYYHFLEGLVDYDGWPDRVDPDTRNLRMSDPPSPWADRRRIRDLLQAVVARFPRAVIALSYRSDGIPIPEDLEADLRSARGQVQVHDAGEYAYALSTNRRSRELLFVAG